MCEAGNRAHIRQTVYSSQLMTIKTQSNEITPTVQTFPLQPISSLPSPPASSDHTSTVHSQWCILHTAQITSRCGVTAATF